MSEQELKEFAEVFQWHYKLSPDSPSLKWRIPFREVVAGMQSIVGIAELARVDRKTVYRRKLKPGSLDAFLFILGQWQGTTRPLVKHKSPRHRMNLNGLLVKLLDFIAYQKKHPVRVKRTWYDDKAELKKWHRKQRISEWEKPAHLKDEKRAEFSARKKAGTIFVYSPEGRVTVAMLCTALKWYRRKFYRWRESLTLFERGLLETALNPQSRQTARTTGVWETREVKPGDLLQTGEDVYEGLYNRIDGG